MAQEKNRGRRGAEEGEKETAANPPRRKGKLLILVLGTLILLLAAGGFAAFRLGFLNLPGSIKEQSHTEVIKEPEFMYEFPEILVNINGLDRRRFLSVKFYLGFDEPTLQQELEKRLPELRDAVNKILWVKSAEDISTSEGKENLRKEILETLNSMLKSGKLRGIYFWHLLIQ